MSDLGDQETIAFNEALELSGTTRDCYLENLGAKDVNLRRRVEGLLRAHEAAGVFLEGTPAHNLLLESSSDSPTPKAAWPAPEKAGERIGRYRLLEQIGEGGCGVVYMAEQLEPVRRRVAFKIIKLGMDTRQVIARFEAERQALAMMDHPNIAKVLDAGVTESGRPFFVMELVRGVKITDFCDQNNVPTPERLRLFAKVCQAIQHAHQKGIIHRDIKPSNLLVTVNDGEPVPKVIDFGIAKATQGRLTDQTLFTAFEQFVGTPAYMSPEQAVMTSLDIDTRSDIYSLGVLLYELLTGTTPFVQKDLLSSGLEEMRRTIREKEPIRPSTRLSTMAGAELALVATRQRLEPPKLLHVIKGDLDWIVVKCLEKDRARRYETANGLAQDVERYLANEPIVARPPSNLYRFKKLVRRNKIVVAAVSAVVLALLIGLGISTWEFIQKSKAEHEQDHLRQTAEKAQANEAQLRQLAETQELASRKRAYAADMSLLQKALADNNLARAQELLNRQRPAAGQKDLRGWEWRYFWQFCQSDQVFTLCQRSNSIISLSFSADGKLLAVGTWLGEVTVWDLATRQRIFEHDNNCNCPRRVAFAPNGDLLAYYEREPDTKKNIVLWNSRTRSEVGRLRVRDTARGLVFSTNGELFTAEQSLSSNITVWDVTNGKALNRYTSVVPRHLNGTVLEVSGDATQFAQLKTDAPTVLHVFNRVTGTATDMPTDDEFISAITFSPDGKRLITGTGYSEGTITGWEISDRKAIFTMHGHHGWIGFLKILPDGHTLVSAAADRTIRLWNLETHQLTQTLRGDTAAIWTASLSFDGHWLASGAADGSVKLWDLTMSSARPPPFRILQMTNANTHSIYSPDGKYFTVIENNCVQLINPETLQRITNYVVKKALLGAFDFSPDSSLLATVDQTGQLTVWNTSNHQIVTNFIAHTNAAFLWGFLPAEQRIVTSDDRTATEWDINTWEMKRQWPFNKHAMWTALSPEHHLAANAEMDSGLIELIDLRDTKNRRQFYGGKDLKSIVFSRDGKTLIALEAQGDVELWDIVTCVCRAKLSSAGLGSYSMALSPDGNRLAVTGDGQQAVKLWDFSSLEELPSLPAKGSAFRNVVFSPDGNTISACNQQSEMYFWSAPSWEQIAAAEKSRGLRSP